LPLPTWEALMFSFEIRSGILSAGRRNISTVLKRYHDRLKRLWRDSVKAFILATVDVMKIDTGMSVASLAPLAAKVRLKTLILETARGRGPRRGLTNLDGSYEPTRYKSKAEGQRLGQTAYTLSFGTPQAPSLEFRFDIVVFQHQFHEPTWQSLRKGEQAFVDYFEKNFDAYINADDLVRYLMIGK